MTVTVSPRTSSTDAWATSVNQTPIANGAARVTYNQWLRDGAPIDNNSQPLTTGVAPGPTVFRIGSAFHPVNAPAARAVIDISSAVETATDSGVWKNAANGNGGPWTNDGIHPLPLGHIAMAALITPGDFA